MLIHGILYCWNNLQKCVVDSTWFEVFIIDPQICREKIREVKAQHKHNLATMVKDNKKCFNKYINGKRSVKEYLRSLLDIEGNMTTEDKEKAEVINDFFTSVCTNQTTYP